MTSSPNYRLPSGYRKRCNNSPFLDARSGLIHQPLVYKFAAYLARRSYARRIIDIGCGSGAKLRDFQNEFEIACIDRRPALEIARNTLENACFINAELEHGLPELPNNIFEDAVIICADVLEHLRQPDRLARDLAKLETRCKFILISTPDRI